MDIVEFIIPWNFDDLLRRSKTSTYYVKHVFDDEEIRLKLEDFQSAVDVKGPEDIVEYFDAFYSALKSFNDLDLKTRQDLFQILITCHGLHYNELHQFLCQHKQADIRKSLLSESLRKHRNILQMTVYLLCQFLERLEKLSAGQTKLNPNLAIKGKKGRKIITDEDSDVDQFVAKQTTFLLSVFETLLLPLNHLWTTPIVDDQFVNCIANVCYKVFENPDVAKISGHEQVEACISVLSVLIKSYRHESVAAIKVVQQLRHFEYLSLIWAQAVAKFIENGSQILVEIFRELSSLELDDSTKDGVSARNYSSFLVELSQSGTICLKAILNCVSLLLCHLDVECYTMRNAVLTILAQCVGEILNGENLNENEKHSRDNCLDLLESHLHDKTAFVRSKCLQLWTKLCEQRAIPKSRLKTLLPLIIGRLIDKGSTVRKNAVQLLTLILKSNPFMASLTVSDVEHKLDVERKKLEKMLGTATKGDNVSTNAIEREIIRQADLTWEKFESEIGNALRNYLEERFVENRGVVDCDAGSLAHFTAESLLTSGYGMISEATKLQAKTAKRERADKFTNACGFVVLARYNFPDHRCFENIEEKFESIDDAHASFMELLKTVYLEYKVAEDLIAQTAKETSFAMSAAIDDESTRSSETSINNRQQLTESPEFERQKKLVDYLLDCKFFAEQLHSVLPRVTSMLHQTQTSDVLEAMEFVVTCHEFNVGDSQSVAVWKCCSLITSKDQQIRQGVLKAFQRLYLQAAYDSNDDQERKLNERPLFITNRLIDLISSANMSQRTSLEEVLCELMIQKQIPKQVLQILWQKFAHANIKERKCALKLLGMFAKAEKSIVAENFDLIVDRCISFTEKNNKNEKDSLNDFEIIKDACVAFEKLGHIEKTKDGEIVKGQPFRLPMDNKLFVQLSKAIVDGFENVSDKFWTPMMERAIVVIFLLANKPDHIAGSILKQAYDRLMILDKLDSLQLSRFMALIGQIALQTFIYIDIFVCRELKRRNLIKENEKTKQRTGEKILLQEKSKKKPGNRRSVSFLKTPSGSKGPGIVDDDDEMGLEGTTAEDAEGEFVYKVCDDDILAENTALGQMARFVVSICKQHQKYNSGRVTISASLALSKIMLISSKFCEQNLPLFFTILQKCEPAAVRANLVISIGDLAFRFPNLLEPWNSNIYKRLNDADLNVRLNCLLILNYLILNDMIKPKGNVADLAVCTLDHCPQVSALAKKFFAEYAEKGNSLYNLLPDIISRLSDSTLSLKSDDFKTVMKFLFSLIHKERQHENLVEKLCQRFQNTHSVENWRYFSYCLALIPYNDRCLKKLNESLPHYASQLGDVEVYENFQSILNACKKTLKMENKEEWISDMEKRFLELHEKHVAAVEANESKDFSEKRRRLLK